MEQSSAAIVWFRNNLRLSDNPSLYHASKMNVPLILLYIAEDHSHPWAMGSASQWWARQSLIELQNTLQKKYQATLILQKGSPERILKSIIHETRATHLFYDRVFEPYFLTRDQDIENNLSKMGIVSHAFNGGLLKNPWDYKNNAGEHWKVFTPFWRKLNTLEQRAIYPTPKALKTINTLSSSSIDELYPLPRPAWYTKFESLWTPGESSAKRKLADFLNKKVIHYCDGRDRPDLDQTSKLSPHLQFGEISPIQIWHAAMTMRLNAPSLDKSIEKFLSELAWREFSHHLLYYFPDLPEKPFRNEFSGFPFEPNPLYLKRWQQGETGYPIVDAGMRELWETGYMHNRVRMISASFLIKHLLQPWQTGEAWFWDTLVDASLANNAASWQWVAGSGADAAPYFRIFNPILQGKKFDPEGLYVKKWVPELKNVPLQYLHSPWEAPRLQHYPHPIIEHQQGRESALKAYRKLKH